MAERFFTHCTAKSLFFRKKNTHIKLYIRCVNLPLSTVYPSIILRLVCELSDSTLNQSTAVGA